MSETPSWFHRRGTLARDGWDTVVDDSLPGWAHTGLRIGELANGQLNLAAAAVERIVVPLSDDVTLTVADGSAEVLNGRGNVFDGPADAAYLPIGTTATLSGAGHVAVAEAPATETLPFQIIRSKDVPVELRGAGRSTRQVHNFGVPGALAAQKLIVCEVITPAENWSSYPPHKHDQTIPDLESTLEEIYYFESAVTRAIDAPPGTDPFGMFATYASGTGQIAITEMVRTGDVALVPHGYHGPAVAAPGYDLYYLNVMAGPEPERAWRITDDPSHSWVRGTWDGQPTDPRLPYTGPKG